MASQLFELVGKVALDGVNEFNSQLKASQTGLMGFAHGLETMGHKMAGTGMALTRGITLPLVALAAAVIKTGGDFDKAMTRSFSVVKNATPAMRKEFEDLAIAMSLKTTFSATELAEAFYYLVTSGIKAETAMYAIETAALFAEAGNMDLAVATEKLTDVVNALGLMTGDTTTDLENMAHASDVIVAASTMAEGTIEQFTDALMEAGGIMQAYGISIEEGTATLAGFALTGLKGQRAGHALMMVIRDMTNAAVKNTDAWDAANIQVFDASGKFNNLTVIIDQLTKHMEGLTHEQKVNALAQLGLNQRTSQYVLRLISVNEHVQQYYKNLQDVAGYTKDVAAYAMQDFYSQLEILRNHLQAVALILWRSFGPVLKDFVIPILYAMVAVLALAAKAFDALPYPIQAVVYLILALAAAIGPLFVIFGHLFIMIGKSIMLWVAWGAALAKLGPVIAMLKSQLVILWGVMAAHPLLLVAFAVGAIIGVFVDLVNQTGSVRGAFAAMWWDILNFAEGVLSTFSRLANMPVLSDALGLRGFGEDIDKALAAVRRMKNGVEEHIDASRRSAAETKKSNRESSQSYQESSEEIKKSQKEMTDELGRQMDETTGKKKSSEGEQTEAARQGSNERILNSRGEFNILGQIMDEWKNKAIQSSQEVKQARAAFEAEWNQKLFELTASRLEIIEQEKQQALAKAEELGANKHAIIQHYEELERQERRKTLNEMLSVTYSALQSLMSEWSTYTSARISQIQNAANREIEAIRNSKMSETQKQQHIQRIQAQTDSKVKALQKAQARREKAMAIFNAIINGAVAITKVWGQLGIFGFVMAGIIAAMTAAQVALIASRPVPMKKGGLVKGRQGGVTGLVGEGSEDELVLPMESGVAALVDALIAEVSKSPLRHSQITTPVGMGHPRSLGYQGAVAAKESVSGSDVYSPVNHWHIGVLVADDRGIKELERRQAKFRISENQRKGLS